MTLGTACGDASSARPGAVVDAVKRVTRPHPKSKTPSPKTSSSVFKSTEPERRLGSGIYSMDLPQTLVLKPRALVDAERMSAADRVRRISVSVRMHVATKWALAEGKMNPRVLRRPRSEEHTSELQSRGHLVCRLLL